MLIGFNSLADDFTIFFQRKAKKIKKEKSKITDTLK